MFNHIASYFVPITLTDTVKASNIKYIAPIFIIVALFLSLIAKNNFIQEKIDTYAIRNAEKSFGSQPVAQNLEEKIRAIAREMGVTEPIIIRKMSQTALSVYGYCNAFAYFPSFFNIIPISNKIFLFISEGFLEDLSPEEQRFLIGHEMVHVKKHHTQYLNLALCLLFIILMLLSAYIHKRIAHYYVTHKWHASAFAYMLVFMCILITQLTCLAYRRTIEREADHCSLSALNSYEGGIKLAERWEKEYKHPSVNSYFGLFADHPACGERKLYCLQLQHLARELQQCI
ncbi:MAG: M48 family metalloprotease [Candidatus Babeliaceae bacterium]|jgi:Zn-dependent protease with chaperone function